MTIDVTVNDLYDKLSEINLWKNPLFNGKYSAFLGYITIATYQGKVREINNPHEKSEWQQLQMGDHFNVCEIKKTENGYSIKGKYEGINGVIYNDAQIFISNERNDGYKGFGEKCFQGKVKILYNTKQDEDIDSLEDKVPAQLPLFSTEDLSEKKSYYDEGY